MEQFKPNIYPIIYWGLLYGVIAGFILFVIFFLSRYLTTIWFPVFLVGLIWGGYRNYKKQKKEWSSSTGVKTEKTSPLDEIKEAAGDIVEATKDMLAEQTQAEAAKGEGEQPVVPPPVNQPPQPPTGPTDTEREKGGQ